MRGDEKASKAHAAAPFSRLRDAPPGTFDETAAWAIDLLREAPVQPPRPDERQRVLFRLRRHRAGARPVWSVRLATVAAALIAATTIAWAGLPRWLATLSRVRTDKVETHVPAARAMPQAPPRTVAQAASAPAVSALPPAPSPVVSRPSEPLRPARRRVAPPAPRESDSTLVVRAMGALRRDGNPTHARALCSAYLERHPNGSLAEEALALTVEAAVAHQDPDVSALSARYLRQYPNGPFAGLAHQASHPPTPVR